jgi:rhamnosyl/mannosyltransferase
VAVGRLVSYKGFDILVRAATQVPARVIICGVGADDARLRRMAGSLGVSDRVSFEGSASTRRLRQLLHAARASVLPSITSAEAFGLVQVEAMFCGTAMINTDLPTAVPWVARDGHEAITVPPGDAEALAGAMRRLAGNADLARRLGAAGRRRAHGLFSAEVFCRSLGRVYREALASGSPSGCA